VPAWLRAAHRVKRVEITGVGQGQELRRVVDRHGRPVYVPPNGMILGRKLAQVLAVGPGDYLTVEVLEGSRGRSEVRVEGTVDELLGLGAYMDSHALANMLHEAGATSRINLRVDSHHAGVLFSVLKRIPAIAGVASREAQRASIQDAMDRSFTTVSLTLTLFAAVIVVGMVYNSIRVALSERGLELASLRVLGFTEREVTVILLGEQASITVAAVPLGLAIGYALCALLVPAFDREAYRLPLVVSGQTLAYAAGTALVAAAACGALVARRLRALDLIAVLKARE
jgi:putative ABC transport system permease protein